MYVHLGICVCIYILAVHQFLNVSTNQLRSSFYCALEDCAALTYRNYD